MMLGRRLLSDTDVYAVTGERRYLVGSCHECELCEWLLSISSSQKAIFGPLIRLSVQRYMSSRAAVAYVAVIRAYNKLAV